MSDLPATAPIGGFDWTNRRRWIWLTTRFCMVVIVYISIFGTDTHINETIVTAAFSLLGFVGGSYCFSAAWEHRSLVAAISRQPQPGESQ